MNLDSDVRQIALILMAALAAAGLALALFYPYLAGGKTEARLRSVAEPRKQAPVQEKSGSSWFRDNTKDRRKQVQEALKQIDARELKRRKRTTVRMLINQAGLEISVLTFWVISAIAGAVLGMAALLTGAPLYLVVLSAFVGLFGLPRWFLVFVRKRRQEKFLNELPEALDVMVRGLRSGLPLSDAMKIIASESPPPIGPEFWEVTEGQRIGLTIDQGFERMYERLPLQEVNFLSIVFNIQSKTGGSLTEALFNLSKVLRDRRKMKSKIRSVSQEAKSSAAIIGALPFVMTGALSLLNPEYLSPLLSTTLGNMMLIFSGIWMLTGVLVMRKMINFDI